MLRWIPVPRRSPEAAAAASRLAALLVALLLGAGVGSAGAADTGRAGEGPAADALRERVEAYWKARVARSEEVYDFYAPVEKGGPERDGIAELGNVYYSDFSVEKVEIGDGDEAEVTLMVGIRSVATHVPPAAMKEIRSQKHEVREGWERVDGTWYREPVRYRLSERLGSLPGRGPEASSPAGEPDGGESESEASEGGASE